MRGRTVVSLLVVAMVASGATAAAAAASRDGQASKASARTVVVTTHVVPGLGPVLANAKGMTLYMFVPDKGRRVTCHAVCAQIWPPLMRPAKARLVARGGVKAKLLGSDRDSTGGLVVTYSHWPLYTYLGDKRPGVAFGQALKLNGGLWYVLGRTGMLIKKKPTASTTSSSSSSPSSSSYHPTTTKATTTTKYICSDDDGDGDQSAGGPDDGDGCI